MNPYNPEALKAEIPIIEAQIKLFEAKAAELRTNIIQYNLWIKEHEDEAAKKLNGGSSKLPGQGEEQNSLSRD